MGRSPCCEKNGLKKGPWTPEEDQLLTDYIQLHGPGNWRSLPNNAGLKRCGKSCRLRWTNYLRPDIKRGRFSFEEEETIIQLHSVLGNKWSAIAARLPGRTDNEIKNYWNTHIRKRLLRMGVDPVTHTPRFDLLDCNNLSLIPSLMGLQALLNPDLLRLLSALAPSNQPTMPQQNQYQYQNQNQYLMHQLLQPEAQHPQVLIGVSGQTTPENSSSPSTNTMYAPNVEQLDAMNSSLEQLINCPSNDRQMSLTGFNSSTPLSTSPNMDDFNFEIPLGSLDLSEFL